MSLTVSQKLQVLIKGNPSPSLSFAEFVHHLAVDVVTSRFGEEIPFIVDDVTYSLPSPLNQLPFTSEQLALCYSYQEKMKAISQNVINGNNSFLSQLTKVVLSFMAQSSISFADLESAEDSDWETYINSHLVTAFELLAVTTQSEITTYKNLVQAIISAQ